MLYIKESNNKYYLPDEEKIREDCIKVSNNTKSLIYFLIKDDQIVYIGKSKKGFKRIFEHKKDFDSFNFIEVDESILDIIESIYIEKYKPILNSNQGKNIEYSIIRNFEIKKPDS